MKQEDQSKKIQKIIAKAWADDAFKERLLSMPSETLKDEGLEPPPNVEVRVVENTDNFYYIVLPPKPSADEINVESLEASNAAGGCCCTSCLSL